MPTFRFKSRPDFKPLSVSPQTSNCHRSPNASHGGHGRLARNHVVKCRMKSTAGNLDIFSKLRRRCQLRYPSPKKWPLKPGRKQGNQNQGTPQQLNNLPEFLCRFPSLCGDGPIIRQTDPCRPAITDPDRASILTGLPFQGGSGCFRSFPRAAFAVMPVPAVLPFPFTAGQAQRHDQAPDRTP